jgi:serine/threonine protein kinase
VILGDYAVYEEIGRGGMGIVYRARQRRLDREVAVKVLRGYEFASTEARQRFRAEATAAARLQHPGIVTIHDIGEDDEVLWFSMDLLPGQNLADRVREYPLPARSAAECTRSVAEAVQHAHDRGILHRDLKPSNILIGEDGQPRIADFGIARRLDPEGDVTIAPHLTETGQALGSPGYASPEQAFGGKADARTDVYGLGALLYHLLTGRPPFQGPTRDSILLQLRESDPVAPRRLNPTVPRDLQTICLQALHKDPARRYASARAFAEDISRFLLDQPVHARRTGWGERTLRLARKRPGTVALALLAVALACGLVIGAVSFGHRKSQLERRLALLSESREFRAEGLSGSKQRALTALKAAWAIQPAPELRSDAIACLTLPDVTHLRTLPPRDPSSQPKLSGGSADGKFTLQFRDGALSVVRSSDSSPVAKFSGFASLPLAQLDDTGKRLAVARWDPERRVNLVVIHAIPSGDPLFHLEHPHPVRCMDWAGDLLAAGGSMDYLVYIWDTRTGRRLHRFNGHDAQIEVVRFRPNGQELVSCAQDSVIRVWHAGRGVEILRIEGMREHVGPAWWSTDGRQFFLPLRDGGGVDVFEFDWPRASQVFAPSGDEPRSENLTSISFHPEGDLLAAMDETACHLWSPQLGRVVGVFPKTDNEWMAARFGDPQSLWLSGWNRRLRRIPIRTQAGFWPEISPPVPSNLISGPLLAATREDGGALALTNNQENPSEDTVEVHYPETGQRVFLHHVDPFCAALSPDGRWAVTGSFQNDDAVLCHMFEVP